MSNNTTFNSALVDNKIIIIWRTFY